MKKLLLVTANQFGYAAGYYHYAKYLRKYYKITFLCFDEHKSKLSLNEIDIIYVKKTSRYVNGLRFLKSFYLLNGNEQYDVVLFRYIPYIFIFKICSRANKNILDIRSTTISNKVIRRVAGDFIIKFNVTFFKNIITLSENLKRNLKLIRLP